MSSNLIRWSGPAAIAAGALLIVAFLLSSFVADGFFYLFGLVFLLLLAALPGLQARQSGRSGLLGRIGFLMALIGVALLGVLFAVVGMAEIFFGFDPDERAFLGLLLVVGFFASFVGIILFGIATARADVLPRGAALLLTLGLPLALAIDILTGSFFGEGEQAGWGMFIGFTIFGVGLMWLGYAAWSGRGASANRPARVS